MIKDGLRTLTITKEIPYPIFGGGTLRNWQNINIMLQYGPVAGFSFSESSPQEIFVPGVPLWKHSIIDKQLSFGEKLKQRWVWSLTPRPAIYSDKVAQELDRFIKEFKPNLVICETVFVYPYLKIIQKYNCRVIFNEHNIESDLFKQRYKFVENSKIKLKAKIQHSQLRSIEKSFINKVDQVWVCSQEDANLLQQLYGKEITSQIIPNGINVSQYSNLRSDSTTFHDKLDLPKQILNTSNRTVLFLGMLSYIPNKIAAELLIEQIYPKLKKIYPDCSLLLVGRNPTPSMLEAAKKDSGIIVTGGVPDVLPYLAFASIMAVPLLQGGGTRFKIVEAFAARCPVVSTTKGAEGLNVKNGEHLLIGDNVEDTVERICQIWSEPSLREKLVNNAFDLVKTQFSWEAVGQKVEKAIQKLF